MPKVPWTSLSELRHELSTQRQVIAFCIDKLKRIDYNILRVQDKLNDIILEAENGKDTD